MFKPETEVVMAVDPTWAAKGVVGLLTDKPDYDTGAILFTAIMKEEDHHGVLVGSKRTDELKGLDMSKFVAFIPWTHILSIVSHPKMTKIKDAGAQSIGFIRT